jgi:hypothetical protein
MEISRLLEQLPGSLEWMVLFRLSTFRQLASDEQIREMYFLSPSVDLASASHVVLTSAGRCLAPIDAVKPLVDGATGAAWSAPPATDTLQRRFADRIALFDIDKADCVGLGRVPGGEPVLLYVEVVDGAAQAQALFTSKPSRHHYELLQAVGVTFEGAQPAGDYVLARFKNRLPQHLHAAALARFTRTDNCNLFFLQHGQIDHALQDGLLKSSENRLRWARDHVFAALERVAEAALARQLPMTCYPPPPREPVPFGDVVPLGFVHAAMLRNPASRQRANVRQTLEKRRVRGLWSFHSGDLDTSTDSVLVLQGIQDTDAVRALERFSDGKGAYVPQRWSDTPEPGKMTWDETKQHWCQADYATTCFVIALHKQAGLPISAESERYLRAGFAKRSGLYFANPYFVDWIVAQAIAGDSDKQDLRQQLQNEISESINADYSFNSFDQPFSTALAILALEALGYHGRLVRAAQLYLLRNLTGEGTLPIATPFYSSQHSEGDSPAPQVITVNGNRCDVYWYRDVHSLIGTAVAAAALSVERPAIDPDADVFQTLPRRAHPRYRCSDQLAYVKQFAVLPYLS